MKKTYRIYRLENQKGEDEVLKFFLPEEGVPTKIALQRRAGRLLELHELKKSGYVITADILTDKEGYLNSRLSVAVSDYFKSAKAERDVRLRSYGCSRYTLCQELSVVIDNKRSAQKRIASLIRRLNREGFEVRNDMALMIYDLYEREICDKEVII